MCATHFTRCYVKKKKKRIQNDIPAVSEYEAYQDQWTGHKS